MEHNISNKKRKPIIVITGATVFLLLLVFLLTPLRERVFSPQSPPTITLTVVEGPEFSEETELYRIMVEALVTGNSEPEVIFNRNDGIGEAERNQALIWLQAEESFIIEAVATNNLGSTRDSLELHGKMENKNRENDDNEDDDEGDEGENRNDLAGTGRGDAPFPEEGNQPPEISGIVFSESPLFTNERYSVTAQTTDPDGDPLSYQWQVTGEGWLIAESTENPLNFTAPSELGNYQFRVLINDGRGGEAEYSETVAIHPVTVISPGPEELFHIIKDFDIRPGVYVGDDEMNRISRGFISFDIDHLTGARVHKAELQLVHRSVQGNPGFMHAVRGGIRIEEVNWGNSSLGLSDYSMSGTRISTHSGYDITITSILGGARPALAEALQRSLDEGRSHFQLRLRFEREMSNLNNSLDGVNFGLPDIRLKIWHEYW